MTTHNTALSKTVSHALRHEPWLYELELDEHGWVSLDSLVDAISQEKRWQHVTTEDLRELVRSSPKQRCEIKDDRIRALYGHSVPGKITQEIATPPEALFHGTASAQVPTILRDGLLPMRRHYVHLSSDVATAHAVGGRRSADVVILRVACASAQQAGVRFYRGNDHVWLADSVPGEWLSVYE